VFGSGVAEADLDGHVEVRDSTGRVYVANLVKIMPDEDWAPDQTFTVTTAIGPSFSFTFSTAPGDPGAPFSDPTPHTGEPDAGALPDEGGCCSTSGGAGGGPLLLALALTVLLRRR